MATRVRSPTAVVNRKRVQRLVRRTGLACLFPRPKSMVTSRCHNKHPYLLKGLKIERPGQAWGADITHVPMPSGFL